MPATRPKASFEPIPPDFDLKALVETTPNFTYVDRISVDMIDHQGLAAFEKLVTLHVIVGGKPLVIDGFEDRLDEWLFSPKWLEQNCGDKVETSRNLTTQDHIPLTMGHYLKNMGRLTNQFFDTAGAHRDKRRQRVYLKDIDCPQVWEDKLREHIPPVLFYLNESTGEPGGAGSVPESNVPGRRLGRGIARAGDLMSSLPKDMRAENLMCYIGHEGTYTPAHREMCASLGQNIMVEASETISDEGKPEKKGSSIWFMTESKDRHTVSEYWLSVLGHDIEVENHFGQVVAWKKAPFNVYVVEQRPGDFILIPPLAPHQVWNRGTRTMKVAWNRTTVETLEMALNEALPRSRIVCRDEQYKNKAIVYYTLQKYSGLLQLVQQQAANLPADAGHRMLYTGKLKQLQKDFKRLFDMFKQVLLTEMFNPEDRDNPKNIEYVPFDGNITCAYCRGNIFNRFLSCPSCKDMLGHHVDGTDGDPYDICLDCYAMGRSCACISNLKWTEQFKWKELASRYDHWRKLIIALDRGQITDRTPLPLNEERKRYGKRTLAEVVKDQLKRRPWTDVHKKDQPKDVEEEDEEIIVGDDGQVKRITKKKSKAWLKTHTACHVCCHRHPNWRMAACTTCDRWWCYGSLFRGWDKMPLDIMEDPNWSCPHCSSVCFAGNCRKDPNMRPYEPKGTLLGHDTKKIADVRSVEALVDFSVSNLNWLRDEADSRARAESKRLKRARADAQFAKDQTPDIDDDDEEEDGVETSHSGMEYTQQINESPVDPALNNNGIQFGVLDPALGGNDDDTALMHRLQQANSSLPSPAAMVAGLPAVGAPEGYAPVPTAGYAPPADIVTPYPNLATTNGSEVSQRDDDEGVLSFGDFHSKRGRPEDDDDDGEDISMQKHPKAKKTRLSAAGFRSTDLADLDDGSGLNRAKNEAQRQFEREKERKALDKAKAEGRYIMLQAARKGKKRIVKMPVPGEALSRMLAKHTARAALNVVPNCDAQHEFDSGFQVPEEEEGPVPIGDILKSDIPQKKTYNPNVLYYEKRVREGKIVTGASKKALVPVERDENYNYHPSMSKKQQRQATRPQNRRKGGPIQEYEEVDIGSDPEEANDDSLFVPPRSRPPASQRRNLPAYLQSRHDDGDALEEPPETLNEGEANRQPGLARGGADVYSGSPAGRTSPSASPLAKRHVRRPAGKRPKMRPAQPANRTVDHAPEEGEDSYGGTDVEPTAPLSFAAINNTATSGTSQEAATTIRPLALQNNMAEENRLAKLQALEM